MIRRMRVAVNDRKSNTGVIVAWSVAADNEKAVAAGNARVAWLGDV